MKFDPDKVLKEVVRTDDVNGGEYLALEIKVPGGVKTSVTRKRYLARVEEEYATLRRSVYRDEAGLALVLREAEHLWDDCARKAGANGFGPAGMRHINEVEFLRLGQ